jgi:DNA-binding response OmpR family regulator
MVTIAPSSVCVPVAYRSRSSVKRILVVDDDDLVRQALAELLTLEEYEVTTAADGLRALELALTDPPDLVIADLQMPRLRGDGLIARMREAGVRAPVIIVTAARGPLDASPERIVRKPFGIDEFLTTVHDVLVNHAARRPD